MKKLILLLLLLPFFAFVQAQAPTSDSTIFTAPPVTNTVTYQWRYSGGNTSNTRVQIFNTLTNKRAQLLTEYQFNHYTGTITQALLNQKLNITDTAGILSNVVHKALTETITGQKSFLSPQTFFGTTSEPANGFGGKALFYNNQNGWTNIEIDNPNMGNGTSARAGLVIRGSRRPDTDGATNHRYIQLTLTDTLFDKSANDMAILASGGAVSNGIMIYPDLGNLMLSVSKPSTNGSPFYYPDFFIPQAYNTPSYTSPGIGLGTRTPNYTGIGKALSIVAGGYGSTGVGSAVELVSHNANTSGVKVGSIVALADTVNTAKIGAIDFTTTGTDKKSGKIVLGTYAAGVRSDITIQGRVLTGITSIDGSAATLTTPRNIQGVAFDGSANINPINGTGFVKASGTTISYDNSTYLTTSSASSTYQPLENQRLSTTNTPIFAGGTYTGDLTLYRSGTPTVGVLFFNQAQTKYISQNGSAFSFVGSDLVAPNIYSSSATPTITAGVAAGTSPTITIAGNNQDGFISITIGTSPTNGTLFTFTMSGGFSYPNKCAPVVSPVGALAIAATTVGTLGVNTISNTGFTFTTGTSVLTAGQAYTYTYHNGGY